MSSPISGSSFVFQDVYIQSVGTTAGIVEHQGPLGKRHAKWYVRKGGSYESTGVKW